MIGLTIGRYQIHSRRGESGVGVMYEAKDLESGASVIMKFLPSDLISTHAAKGKLEANLALAGKIVHPHVCRAIGLGTAESGEPYIVTELFSGTSMEEAIAAGPFSPARAVELAIQICAGLGAGHRLGVIHRDLTPGNLLLLEDDTVKILDFGFAGLDREASLTLTGAVAGSVAYLAPEQLEGAELSPSTDVWALGLLMFEMMSGRRPFERFSLPTTFEAILAGKAPDLRELSPSVPAELETVISKCLAKSPVDRYSQAEDLASELRKLDVGAID